MENRGGRMHSHVHTELYVHTICKNMMNKIVVMFAAGLMILFALSAFVVMVRKIYIEKQGKTRRKK